MAASSGQRADFERRFGAMLRFANVSGLVRGGASFARWDPDGALVWSDGNGDVRRWHPDDQEESVVVDFTRLRRALSPLYAPAAPPGAFEQIQVLGLDLAAGQLDLTVGSQVHRVDLATYRISKVPADIAARGRRLLPGAVPSEPEDAVEIESPSGILLGLHDRNLYLREPRSEYRKFLTSDSSEAVEWRYPSCAWSPSGDVLIAARYDVAGIPRRPLVHWTVEGEPVEFVPRTQAGAPLARITTFLIDPVMGHRTVIAIDGDDERACVAVGWCEDGSRCYFIRGSRDLRQIELIAADRASGRVAVVLEERDPCLLPWSEVASLVTPVARWRQFLWRSERSGWAHLYLHSGDGAPIRQVTRGEMMVTKVVAIDEQGRWVYFLGQSELRAYDIHLYRAHLDDATQTRLTDGPGVHEPTVDPSHRYFFDRRSTLSEPPEASVRSVGGAMVKDLGRADIRGLVAVGWGPPEEVIVTAADGVTDLYGVLFKPTSFDGASSYPIVDWIYGGPQLIWAPKRFLDPLAVTPRAMAELGFIVLVLDGRGTSGRGKPFQDVARGSFGRHVIDDHVAAIEQLAGPRPWIDRSRVGVTGGSWGGYMTIRALLTAPRLFKVGVALNPPVTNREGAEIIEPFLGRVDDNPTGYADADLMPLANQLEGKLLVMAGNLDTLFGSSVRLAEAFIKAGKDFDFAILPDQRHAVSGEAARFMLRKRAAYLVEHLL